MLGKPDSHMPKHEILHLIRISRIQLPKWIKNLNKRTKTIKLLEENIELMLHETGFGNDFLDMASKA